MNGIPLHAWALDDDDDDDSCGNGSGGGMCKILTAKKLAKLI
jgi:hypothetical protein